jgi:hypothetical protein
VSAPSSVTAGGPATAPSAAPATAAPATAAPIGAATATIVVDGATTTVTNGWCQALPEGFLITVGARSYPIDPPLPDFFGLTIEGATADGTFSGRSVVGPLVVLGQAEYAMAADGRVTLSGGRTAGTFEGPLERGAGTISGSFSCAR